MLNRGYFKLAGDLTSDELSNYQDNIFTKLINNNSYTSDLQVLDIYLKIKKAKNISATSFLYAYSFAQVIQDIPIEEFIKNMTKILEIEEFDISANKMGINGFTELNQYDYRITLSNSNNICFSDIQYLMNAFNLKAKEKGIAYGLKFEPDATDLLILYFRENTLENAVNILEDLKNNDNTFAQIVNKLGKQKPFTSSINDNSFYGVSMGTSRIVNNNFKGFLAIGKTFTEYIADLIDKAYINLLNKYGSLEKITPIEMYEMMVLIHKNNYGFSLNEDVPLWMNKDNYEKYCKKRLKNPYNL